MKHRLSEVVILLALLVMIGLQSHKIEQKRKDLQYCELRRLDLAEERDDLYEKLP